MGTRRYVGWQLKRNQKITARNWPWWWHSLLAIVTQQGLPLQQLNQARTPAILGGQLIMAGFFIESLFGYKNNGVVNGA